LPHKLKYRVLAERLVVCRAAVGAPIPEGSMKDEFFCIARIRDELSVVCDENRLPQNRDGWSVEIGWVALKLEGSFPFSMTGVLSSFLDPLAGAGIPIFAISTFDTDYVLIKNESLQRARAALGAAGHEESSG
jgi:uncharacterized protein